MTKVQAIAAAIFAALLFLAGWMGNGWRHEAELFDVKRAFAEAAAKSKAEALERYQTMEKQKNEAIEQAKAQAARNAADAVRARAAADGLREQVRDMPGRIAAASRAAVDEYAATAGELLGACAAEYQYMAEQADRHLANERLLMDAWPR